MGMSIKEQTGCWGAGFVIVGVLLWLVGDTLLPFVLGATIAYLLDPVADRLERMGLSRILATTVITLVIITAMIGLIFVMILSINQLGNLTEFAPRYLEAARQSLTERFPDLMVEGSDLRNAISSATTALQDRGLALVNQVLVRSFAVVDFVVVLVLAPVVAFYLLMDWDHMVARIDGLLPREHAPVIRGLAGRLDNVLAGFVRGQLTVCALLGVFYATALSVAGLQFGLVIGLFAGLISFIPFIGSIVGGLLSLGVALFQFWGEWPMIALVAGIFMIGQAVEGNVLTPKLVGGSVGLHPVWLIFALSAFGALFGFVGLLIAVPLAAAIGVMVRFGLEQYQNGRLYRGPAQDVD